MYGRLVAYKNKYNTTCVPKKWKEDPQLTTWVNTQRHRCKDKNRTDLLNNIGFEWIPNVLNLNVHTRMEMYGRLVAYKKKHNTTSVPIISKEDPKFGRLVNIQCRRCTVKNRTDLLNSLGFEWTPKIMKSNVHTWMEMYGRLVLDCNRIRLNPEFK